VKAWRRGERVQPRKKGGLCLLKKGESTQLQAIQQRENRWGEGGQWVEGCAQRKASSLAHPKSMSTTGGSRKKVAARQVPDVTTGRNKGQEREDLAKKLGGNEAPEKRRKIIKRARIKEEEMPDVGGGIREATKETEKDRSETVR